MIQSEFYVTVKYIGGFWPVLSQELVASLFAVGLRTFQHRRSTLLQYLDHNSLCENFKYLYISDI